MATNKNIPSNNPKLKRYKKVAKELGELLRDLGYGNLFPTNKAMSEKAQKKWGLRKTRIVQQALEFGMQVPQALVDEVTPPPEPNPPTNYVDDGKAPF